MEQPTWQDQFLEEFRHFEQALEHSGVWSKYEDLHRSLSKIIEKDVCSQFVDAVQHRVYKYLFYFLKSLGIVLEQLILADWGVDISPSRKEENGRLLEWLIQERYSVDCMLESKRCYKKGNPQYLDILPVVRLSMN